MGEIINFPSSLAKTISLAKQSITSDTRIIILLGNGDDLEMVTNMQDMNDVIEDLDDMIVELEGQIE
jgi:hypothetical protein